MTWKTPKQSVLVPFVISHPAIEAMEVALEFVGGAENVDKIHVIHVITQNIPMSPGVVFETYAPVDLERTAELEIRKQLEKAGFGRAQVHITLGEPASEIREAAEEYGTDLIVMPSHGRSGLERWFLGSVAEHVLRDAPCPVLVLPLAQLEAETD